MRVVGTWAPWLLVAMAACADSHDERLKSGRFLWQAAAVTDYSFRYRTTGFAQRVDVRVTVESGTVTRVERLGGEVEVATEAAPTIDSLFEEIARAIDTADLDVRVDYDATLGYPVSASFAAGTEVYGFEVSELGRLSDVASDGAPVTKPAPSDRRRVASTSAAPWPL